MDSDGATMNERTPFEREMIAQLNSFVNGSEHPTASRNEVLTARILLDHFERHGLAAAAKLVCQAKELGDYARARA